MGLFSATVVDEDTFLTDVNGKFKYSRRSKSERIFFSPIVDGDRFYPYEYNINGGDFMGASGRLFVQSGEYKKNVTIKILSKSEIPTL